ncbi:MAG TPA: NADPH-dependent F420 reductase [Candidatus Limnocylindrales bacterium]|nr:NADPH-dependent F420 reductase [Candidatus Limnocylindrales bacterium]
MRFDVSMLPDVGNLLVGILGGTGDQGRGLAMRLASAGQRILIGSRTSERAAAAAKEVAVLTGGAVEGDTNFDVASRCDVVIVAVPYEGHAETLASLREPLAGKIVVDCVNPLGFDKKGPFILRVPEGSVAEQAASILPDSRVCAAFHHVSAELLTDPSVEQMDLDVLVLGDDREAVRVVQALAARIPGMRGLHAGRLRNAGQVEALTANLISINKRYGAHAGIRVTDV